MTDAGNGSASSRGGAAAGGSTGGGGGLEPIWMGIGSPKPQPRIKQNSMFGHVVDAFDEKSIIKIGQPSPYEKRMKAEADAAAAAAAAAVKVGEESDASSGMEKTNGGDGEVERNGIVESTDAAASSTVEAATVGDVSRCLETLLDLSGKTQILITGGRVVNDDQSFDADIYIVDGKIILVGSNLNVPSGAKIIDARGKLVFPGGVDSSTRLQAPFLSTTSVDGFSDGTKSALAGGTTTIVDVVVPERGQSLVDAYTKRRETTDAAVCCDFALRVAVASWSEQIMKDMEVLAKEKGVNSFVLSLAGESSLDDTSLYEALKHCRQLGAMAFIEAENGCFAALKAKELKDSGITGPEGHLLSRPEDVEASTVYRAVTLASQANAPICVTKVTSKMSADVIARSRRQGKVVFGESLLAALALDGSHLYDRCWRHAAAYVTSPPLRPAPDTPSCLVNRLANGDLQLVASDHCTFNADQKAIGKDDFRFIPPGTNGVEERLAVTWNQSVANGKMDPCRFVAVTSTNAAKLFNIYPRKGRVAVGSDADLVVWNPDAERTISASKPHHGKFDFNVYEGLTCRGAPAYVISAGNIVLDEEGLHVAEGSGQYVNTPCGAEYAYGRIWAREKMERPQSVLREATDMPASRDLGAGDSTDGAPNAGKPSVGGGSGEFYSRPPTRSGGRNMQDSTFSFSGMSDSSQIDDPIRPAKKGCGTRINQPPGGRTSTQLW